MTRAEALAAAVRCFNRAEALNLAQSSPENNKALALRAQALAEVGRGYIELAKEMRAPS
jgi:hypothetical protein